MGPDEDSSAGSVDQIFAPSDSSRTPGVHRSEAQVRSVQRGAIVQVDGAETTTHYIKRPFQREPDFDATSVIYNVAKLLGKAQA